MGGVLLASVAVQFTATGYALEAAYRARRRFAWVLVALGLLGMTLRSGWSLWVWANVPAVPTRSGAEVLALVVSGALLVGVVTLVGEMRRTADPHERGAVPESELADPFRRAVVEVTQGRTLGERLEELIAERTEMLVEANAELQLMNQRLETLVDLKEQFFAFTTHELRSPLNAIIGFSGLLLGGTPGPLTREQRAQLTMLNDSARHMLAVVNDLLDLESLEADTVTVRRESFDLRAFLETLAQTVQAQFAEAGVPFQVRLVGPCECPVESDRTRLRQILLNLLGNALKYAPSGSVVLSGECRARVAVVSVSDTGPGIPRDELIHVYEPFVRFPRPGTESTPSTGLGLAVTRRLVDALGGSIEVDSEVGVGTTFTVTVPLQGGAGRDERRSA